jgi:N-acetylneuraminate synthase
MFDEMTEVGLPFLLSTGMSPVDEIDAAVKHIHKLGMPVLVFQCTTCYPCPPERTGLNMLAFFRERYSCPVGLSDHSGTVFPGLAAVTLGADMLEVHITLSREMFGPDVPASVTTSELRQLVAGVRMIETMLRNPVDRRTLSPDLVPLREMFFKSVVPRVDLPAGTTVQAEHLTLKKPGTGIPAPRLDSLVGRKLRRDVSADEILQESDFAN